MSQTQEKKDVIGADSTVIQCPSCLTRFAVESEAVHASEDPRFHCSRCDYVFPLDEANVTVPLLKPGLGEPLPVREERNPWAESLATSTTDQGAEPSNNPVKVESGVSGLGTSRDEPLPTFASNTYEVPRAYGAIAQREPPVEALLPENENQISFRFSSAAPASRSRSGSIIEPAIVRARSEDFDNILDPKPQPYAADFTINQTIHEQTTSTPDRNFEGSSWSSMSRNPFAEISRSQAAGSIRAGSYPAASQPVLTIAAPLLLFLAFLAGVSYYLHTNPSTLDRIGKGILANAPQTAPPGLYIERAQLKRVVLDDGETVLVLAGGLINQTDKAFREVVVEGLAFDASGQSVIRTRVRADQDLSRTKIHGLSVPLIQEQQKKQRVKRFSMKPGERHQFEFALLSPDASQAALKQARSFSARIYSAQPVS